MHIYFNILYYSIVFFFFFQTNNLKKKIQFNFALFFPERRIKIPFLWKKNNLRMLVCECINIRFKRRRAVITFKRALSRRIGTDRGRNNR